MTLVVVAINRPLVTCANIEDQRRAEIEEGKQYSRCNEESFAFSKPAVNSHYRDEHPGDCDEHRERERRPGNGRIFSNKQAPFHKDGKQEHGNYLRKGSALIRSQVHSPESSQSGGSS
ncbi:hypothetical protein [Aeromicrobium sp. UC242_57]|uniref:hypothetical protein n=1 Tax=Aeromicrobium sp. UC242_57 TaxID=3374624 RepID=UPI0037B17B1B